MIKKLTQLKKISVVPSIFYLTFPQTLDAYLDPGTGSIILQVVIGVAVGGLFTITLFWHRVKSFFKNLFSRGEKHENEREQD